MSYGIFLFFTFLFFFLMSPLRKYCRESIVWGSSNISEFLRIPSSDNNQNAIPFKIALKNRLPASNLMMVVTWCVCNYQSLQVSPTPARQCRIQWLQESSAPCNCCAWCNQSVSPESWTQILPDWSHRVHLEARCSAISQIYLFT